MAQQKQTIFLNLADENQLAGLPGLSSELARALIRARPFRAWPDVQRVEGIDSELAAKLKSQGVELGEPSAGPIGEPGSGGSGGSGAGNLGRA